MPSLELEIPFFHRLMTWASFKLRVLQQESFHSKCVFLLTCYASTRSEMHLELKAVRYINNSHIRKSTCLYTHLYTFIFVQLINSIERSHCKDEYKLRYFFKAQNLGVCENSPPLSSLSFRFVCFPTNGIFAGRCLEDVSGESHAGCERIAGAAGWGCIAYHPLSPTPEVTPKKG